MEENIKSYHPLGQKTLFMMVLQKSAILISLLPVLFLMIFFLSYVPVGYFSIAINIILGFVAFLLVFAVLSFFAGWLSYQRYGIFVDDKDLKISRGLISTEEMGIPYRYIKDLKIDRGLIDQIVGVSNIIITVLGSEENQFAEKESTVMMPYVEKNTALEIQDIILKKVQVEQVSFLNVQRAN